MHSLERGKTHQKKHKQPTMPQGLKDMVSPAGHGHAPRTQTAPPQMAQPYFGTTAETDTARSVGSRKICHAEREIVIVQ